MIKNLPQSLVEAASSVIARDKKRYNKILKSLMEEVDVDNLDDLDADSRKVLLAQAKRKFEEADVETKDDEEELDEEGELTKDAEPGEINKRPEARADIEKVEDSGGIKKKVTNQANASAEPAEVDKRPALNPEAKKLEEGLEGGSSISIGGTSVPLYNYEVQELTSSEFEAVKAGKNIASTSRGVDVSDKAVQFYKENLAAIFKTKSGEYFLILKKR